MVLTQVYCILQEYLLPQTRVRDLAVQVMVTSIMLYPDQHHTTLYFEDGNVVLSAVDKRDTRCYFRVHRSILCRYSPVFQEMFMLPPLTEEGPEKKIAELYDGVLEVQMADSAEDVDSFLSVLYDPTCVSTLLRL